MRKRIVFLSSRFPLPLTKGDRLRAYHHLMSLALHADVYLIAICEEHPSEDDINVLSEHLKEIIIYKLSYRTRLYNLVSSFLSALPLQVRYFYDKKIGDMIVHRIQGIQPHAIHTHLIRMAPYVLQTPKDEIRTLDYMDSMVLNDLAANMFSRSWKKLFLIRERKKVQRYETEVIAAFDQAYVISSRDLEHFELSVQTRIKVIPNGVNLSYYLYKDLEERPFDIGYAGNLGYHANLKALDELRVILDRDEHLTAAIAGADPPDELAIANHPRCHMMGFLEDIRTLYYSVKIFVAPIFSGSGMQNKILESMACGTPCITTTFVNESIGAEPDEEIIIADDLPTFLRKINHLLSHPDDRQRIASKARKFVEQYYTWNVHNQKLIEDLDIK